MAGEAELEPAAERRAVDRRGPRFAAGLDLPEQEREIANLREQPRLCGLLALLAGDVAEDLVERFEKAQIGPGAETVLRRSNHGTLDGGIALDPFADGIELAADLGIDDVHRTARHVPSDERDSVAVYLELEIGEGHRLLLITDVQFAARRGPALTRAR